VGYFCLRFGYLRLRFGQLLFEEGERVHATNLSHIVSAAIVVSSLPISHYLRACFLSFRTIEACMPCYTTIDS
jgi:hypothetical protein